MSRPKPLYPKITFQKLLFCEPPMYGRLDAGESYDDRDPPARRRRASRRPATTSWRIAPPELRRPGEQVARAPNAGQHEERLQLLGEEPKPTQRAGEHEPARAAVFDARGSSRTRRPTSSSTSSASGLLNRNISVGDRRGREHRAGDAAPAAGENQRSHGRVEHADRGDALERLRYEDAPRVHAEDAGRELHRPTATRASCRR